VRKASLLAATTTLTFVAIAACSSDPPATIGSGTKDAGGAAVDARNPYPSFKDDVVPIVQATCALTACHSSKQSNLGIFLAFDPAQIYGELQKTSPTASGEKFVVPGDPAKSYLMVKLEGKQAALAAKCTGGSCGAEMPPGSILPADKLETVRKWISEGAKDN
jgi:hypothetical protein